MLMDILIFKTNLADKKHVKKLFPLFRSMQGISRWNVDLEDCEKILRIEAEQLCAEQIETMLANAGYFCEELQD